MRKIVGLLLSVLLLSAANVGWANDGAAVPRPAQEKSAKKTDSATLKKADAKESKAPLKGLDEFIQKAMDDYKCPGLALAIVQDGKVILSKGYGYRDLERKAPVTTKTLFAIGSITKSFNVASLGTLVDQGKLDLDKPVRDYLPFFHMNDETATAHMTPRDLVTHRSGLPRHDLMWYNSESTRQQVVDRLRFLEPNKDFRSLWQYNNLMFMTAGVLGATASGMPWEQLVRTSILQPLGMTSSNLSVNESQKASDFALPYDNARKDGKDNLKQIPFRVIDLAAPAGSINSNVEDMTQYLQMYLNQGKHGGTQVVSESNIGQMTSPQMVISAPLRFKEVGYSSYGMGLFIDSYRGHVQVSHGGNIDGFSALFGFLPQDNLGFVILTNLNISNAMMQAIVYNIYDRLLGLDQVPWEQRFLELRAKGEQSQAEAKEKGFTAQKKGTHPSHDLKDYVGDYEHHGYGVLNIGLEGNDLTLTFNRITTRLAHFHYDIFEGVEDPLNPFEKTKVAFSTDTKGDIGSVAVPFEPNVKDIVFTRRADKSLTNKTVLSKFAGTYELGAVSLSVTLRGDGLILSIAGQRPYTLFPRRGTTFDLEGLPGFSIEFKMDASGNVTEAAVYQPNGTFAAKKKP